MSESSDPTPVMQSKSGQSWISIDAKKITGINSTDVQAFLDGQSVSLNHMSVLSMFTTQRAESGKIQDDERLVGIIEGLIGEFEVATENLALLSGVKVDNIQAILNNRKSLEDSRKYARAMRMSYWNLVFANSRI